MWWCSAVRFIVTLALSLLVAPLVAETQPRARVPRIGYIGDTPGPYAEAFRQGLRERGYIEGETIAIEYRWQEGRHERLPDLVAELVQLRVDILVPVGTQPSHAAKQATSTIPIVMAQVGDPVGSGLVASLARREPHGRQCHRSRDKRETVGAAQAGGAVGLPGGGPRESDESWSWAWDGVERATRR